MAEPENEIEEETEEAESEIEASGEAEEDGEGEGAEGQNKSEGKLSGKKLILFYVLPVTLAIVIGVTLAVVLFGLGSSEEEVVAEEEEISAEAVAKSTVFYELPEMLVNLNTQSRKASYLKISVSLELDNANDIPRIEAVMPRIVDKFQVYLRELRVEDLNGSSGIYRLREELLRRVVVAAEPAKVRDILFKEMLVQ
ncbi:MAG: flagellar basal body-associated FliL family protein [Alphaproteobacteria bacterium]